MKLTTLFVDDDENIISGIRRMMYPLRNEWNIMYSTGGAQAMEILKEKDVDVIVSDIRMPGIDGNQLLTMVKEKYPQIIRITLSGYANDSLALRNTRIVHQSLAKPSTPETIKQTIEKAFKLRHFLENKELLELVNGINELPSLPEIYIKLEEEINSPNTSIDKIANIIVNDPIITAKILQLTNSAFFGLPAQITNVQQALNYLGIKIIQNLVLSIKLFKTIDSKNPNKELYQEIFNHSNKVAFLAQKLSKLKNSSKMIVEETFLSGLLHDIGKLVILQESKEIKFENEIKFNEFVKNTFSATQAKIGAYLLGIWGLPDSIVEAVAYHDNHELQNFEANNTSLFVFMANKLLDQKGIDIENINSENVDDIFLMYGKSVMEEK